MRYHLHAIFAGSAEGALRFYGVTIPPGCRGWEVVSVAHEAGNLNDIHAIAGNAATTKAFCEGTRSFPDGTIIARLAWKDLPSDENNAVFGRFQSFVAGPATNVQFMVKDTKKYAGSGGWGFGQLEDGKPTRDEAVLKTCFRCREPERAGFCFYALCALKAEFHGNGCKRQGIAVQVVMPSRVPVPERGDD
jgi:hypothetical protein